MSFLMIGFLSLNVLAQQFADVGFQGNDDYIGIEITEKDFYKFTLCSTRLSRCSLMSDCEFGEPALLASLDAIGDLDIKNLFLSHQSAYAKNKIERVYPQIARLLIQTRPECSVTEIKQVRALLHPERG